MDSALFTIYNSSAGSGKTTTLVKEYLALCLPNPRRFNRIIGITFTNKATAEMKERILRDLQNLISYDANISDGLTIGIVKFIHEKTGLSEEQISARSKELLERIIHQYSDFAFSTIDSFVMRIVRSFAYELNLALNFEIELDKDEMISQAVQSMLLDLSKDKNLKRILVQFTLSQMDNERNWNIDNEVASLAGLLFDSANYEHITKLKDVKIADYEKAIVQIKKQIRGFEEELKKQSTAVLESIQGQELDKKDFFRSAFPTYFEYLNTLQYDKFKPNSYVLKAIEEDKWYTVKASGHVQAAIDANKDEWRLSYQQILQFIEEQLPNIKALQLIYRKVYPLAVLTHLQHLIQKSSDENNIIHISESNRRIASIVEQESVPFIYERIGQKYDHYLIDEFQDTSRLQWNNLMPLVENSLAGGHFNMLVGDAKQSIYRWRDGDVEQFIQLQDKYARFSEGISAERETYIKQHLHLEDLKENHRSGKEITEFNNHFFQYYLANQELSESIQKVYASHLQTIPLHREKAQAYVQINIVDKEAEKEKEYIQNIADSIQNLIESKTFHPKDICILGRKHQELAMYAEALNERGIEVVSSDVAELIGSEKVSFLISFFRWLQNSQNQSSFFHILQYIDEHFSHQNQDLFELSGQFEFGKFFNPQKVISLFERLLISFNIQIDIHQLKHLSAFEVSEILIHNFQLEKKPDIFLQFFMDSILGRNRRSGGHINDFLQWWDEKGYKEKVKIPEDLNAVRLFTVHSSKGLQFPVVYHCLNMSKGRSFPSQHWVEPPETLDAIPKALVEPVKAFEGSLYQEIFDEEKAKEDLDLLNLTYVAFTRPTEHLYIYVNESHPYFPSLQNFVIQQDEFKQDSDMQWSSGELVARELEEHQEQSKEIQEVIHQDWQESVQLHFVQEQSKSNEAREEGNRLHAILSWIKYQDDIEFALQKAIFLNIISEDEKESFQKQLEEIVYHSDIAPYFENGQKIYNERSLLSNGQILRPDRMVENDKDFAILDYKRIDFETISDERLAEYQLQIIDYRKALSKLTSKKIKSYLVFLKGEIKLLEI